jgi:hypothetical protein
MATGGRLTLIDSAVNRPELSVGSRRGEAMPEMFLALSSIVAVVAVIMVVLSSTQRRKLAADLEKASADLTGARREREDAASEPRGACSIRRSPKAGSPPRTWPRCRAGSTRATRRSPR